MATYIIGDVQGCYESLQDLLKKIQFNENTDRLGFVGDLVNRGPESLKTLRFIKSLKDPIIVLGNHDLYLLAIYYGVTPPTTDHKLYEIINADDCDELIAWLQKFPLIDEIQNNILVHGGIPPQWSITNAKNYAQEFSEALDKNPKQLLNNMIGDVPNTFSNDLQGFDRLRYIVNAFSRIRFCDAFGQLDLINKTATSEKKTFKPWFEWRKNDSQNILFGHWASLEGRCDKEGYTALDTGCGWGNKLTAIRLEDRSLLGVKSSFRPKPPSI